MGKRAALFPSSEVIEELVVGDNHILPDPSMRSTSERSQSRTVLPCTSKRGLGKFSVRGWSRVA